MRVLHLIVTALGAAENQRQNGSALVGIYEIPVWLNHRKKAHHRAGYRAREMLETRISILKEAKGFQLDRRH
jgi:hypothetical protein